MKLIDLKDYAHFSKKVPTQLLDGSKKPSPEVLTRKILLSHLIDSYIIAVTYVLVSNLSNFGLYNYLISNRLDEAFEKSQTLLFHIGLVAALFWGYFFCSYFFNHGQTFGMFKTKMRVRIKHKSFRAAFAWSFYSFCVITSGGILASRGKQWLKEDGHGALEIHDHLYRDLIETKEWAPVNLVNMTVKERANDDIILDRAA